MAIKTVTWSNSCPLSLGSLPADVILCINPDYVVAHPCFESDEESLDIPDQPYEYGFIEAELLEVVKKLSCSGGCTTTYYRHTFSYDDAQLVTGTELKSTDISGAFPKDCRANWTEQKIGDEIKVEERESGVFTIITQHGCEYEIDVPAAQVNISEDSGNLVELREDGLFVPCCVEVSEDSGNLVELREDGLFVPCCVEISLDSGNIIELREDGLFASALSDVAISEDSGNILETREDGLFVPCCVEISEQSGNAIQMLEDGLYGPVFDAVISEQSGNILEELMDGLYVPCCVEVSEDSGNAIELREDGLFAASLQTGVSEQSGNIAQLLEDGIFVPCCVEVSEDAGNAIELREDGLFAPEYDLTVQDTNSIDLSISGAFPTQTISADVLISATAANAISIQGDGLYALAYQLAVVDSGTVDFTISSVSGGQSITAVSKISANAGNIITAQADGLHVLTPAVNVVDSDTLDLSASGSYSARSISGTVKISANSGNIISAETDGLYAPCCDVAISEDSGNIIEERDDGLYATAGDSSFPFTCALEQEGHGFSVLEPIFYDNDISEYALAQADEVETLADLIVVRVPDADSFYAVASGDVIVPSHGLNVGSWYGLSTTTPGAIVELDTLDFCAEDLVQKLLFVKSSSCIEIKIESPIVNPECGEGSGSL